MIKISKITLLASIILFLTAATSNNSLKLYLVVSSRLNDRTVEKIFLYRTNAVKYIETYKESHNYGLEEININE